MESLIHLIGPLHPPLVHFAVACPILAFLAVACHGIFKKEWLLDSAAALWFLTFLSSTGAFLTGHLFSLHLGMVSQWALLPPETAMKGVLKTHVIWGTLSWVFSFAALGAAIGIFRAKPWPSGVLLSIGFLAALLCGLTGHEGGEMVYGSEESSAASSPLPVGNLSDPLEAARDYRHSLVKMNSKPWNSRTHGHRWVNTYVSKEAADAYKNSNPLPEGSLVVKESFEDLNGKISDVPGPLYVMRKGKAADSPSTGGWQYALAWEKPAAHNPENILMPVKWLPGDSHLSSCVKCHNHFKTSDYVGGIPEGYDLP